MGWLLKLATGNPITLLWIVGAIALAAGAAGASAGWTLNGWRLSSQIADVKVKLGNSEARVVILEPANAKCAVDVAGVKQAFSDWQATEKARIAAVKAAVAKSELAAAANLETARLIMLAPRPQVGQECAAIVQEEQAYVRSRQQR